MQAVQPLRRDWPLHDVAATRAIESAALAGLPPHTLMRRAGAAVARLALAVAPHAERVWVAAGPGNNGGDGLDAAIHLQAAGKRVRVSLLGQAEALPPDAADALARARAAGVPIEPCLPAEAPDRCTLAIDGLLGIGARRPPEGSLAEAIRRLCAAGGDVLAIDLPSGLHADTGQPLGDAAVRAGHSLCLLTLKPGLWTGRGRDHAGRVWLDTLGLRLDVAAATARLGGPPLVAPRRHAQHKGSFGDVHVIGGARGMTGAALLAARAAHAAGAGRVYVGLLDTDAPAWDAGRPELMFRRAAAQAGAGGTVLCGCGGGEAVRTVLADVLAHAQRLVLDADALNAVAAAPDLRQRLKARSDARAATILTPHPLEAARLLGRATAEVQADRLAAAGALASDLGAIVVLKGSGSIVAAPGRLAVVNPTGNVALATAGTGDVLAGWIAGHWAQQADAGVDTALGAAAAAAYRHGEAVEGHGDRVMRAADLVERMHACGATPTP